MRKWILFGLLALLVAAPFTPPAQRLLKWMDRHEVNLMLRDFIIAVYANAKAGDKIPMDVVLFEQTYSPMSMFYGENAYEFDVDPDIIDYHGSRLMTVWNIRTNSLWLGNQVYHLVPMFSYEGFIKDDDLSWPRYAVFTPRFEGRDYIHQIGYMATAGDGTQMVNLNDRLILRNVDMRRILSTLTHELIHAQGGDFNSFSGPSHEVEPKTQAATMEVLAAMCNYRRPEACQAFWLDVRDWAAGSLWMRMRMAGAPFHQDEWVEAYKMIANIFWKDRVDMRAWGKSLRFWYQDDEHVGDLYDIISQYEKTPWERYILPGTMGHWMKSGLYGEAEQVPGHPDQWQHKVLYVVFDDTRSMFPNWILQLISRMPFE